MIELLLAAVFLAWRNSKTSVDPDWAYFNLWGFTGSIYGRDFADCKTPAIHLWYWLLSRLVGKNTVRVKFAHHFLLSLSGVLLYHLTGNFWNSMLFIVMLNSGWLLGFHGNVSQHPAVFIALAFAMNNEYSPVLWLMAMAFEPKLLPSFAILYFKIFLLLVPFGILLYLFRGRFQWLWESSFEIPKRIGFSRKGLYDWMPWYTASTLLYILPPLFFSNPDWLPIMSYVLFIAFGRVVRQNHLIPLIAWVSLPPSMAVFFILLDAVSSGFYAGNPWQRFYAALDQPNKDAEEIGKYLLDKPGSLYVNSFHSGIYVHSRKPVEYGYTEQVEIRENTPERMKEFAEKWKLHPADWVVKGFGAYVDFKPVGYSLVKEVGENKIYRRQT